MMGDEPRGRGTMNRLFAVFLIALLGSGCATYKAGITQARSPGEYPNTVLTASGVEAAAELYSGEAEVKRGFYVDVNNEGYFPVQLIVRNNSDGRILLPKETIRVVDSSGREFRPVPGAAMADEFEKNKMAYALLGFGIFSYMSAEDANEKMRADWTGKELGSDTIINGGRSMNGFVYFKMPNGMKPDGMRLEFEAETLDGGNRETVSLVL